MTPVVISDEDWNRFCYPNRTKKLAHREGIPEHLAMPSPQPNQLWTVVYKVYSEVTAPNYQEAIKAAEKLTGYSKDHLFIEMGAKQPNYPPPIKHGDNQSESPGHFVEKRRVQKSKDEGSSKARKNKIRTRSNRKSRKRV